MMKNKTTKWIVISSCAALLLLLVLKQTGVLGKEEGIKVTAEEVKKKNHYGNRERQWKNLSRA